MQTGPSSNLMMFQAVLWWIISWWLIELVQGEPMGTAVGTVLAFLGLGLAIGSVTSYVPQPSPWQSKLGQIVWSFRPRKWLIAWVLIIGLIAISGRPAVLLNYGGGRCQYIDWWLQVHNTSLRWHPSSDCRVVLLR